MDIFDVHNDYLTKYKTDKKKLEYLQKSNNQGAKCILSAVWTSKTKEEDCVKIIGNSNSLLKNTNCFVSIEDLHFVSYDNIDEIIKIKPIYAGLTWNHENKLGGGANTNVGLSTFGKLVAHKLENEGIQLDTAHLSEKGFLDLASISERPILCSHTAFDFLCHHCRNLKNYQIKIIEASKGLIGITFVAEFLKDARKANVNDIVSHIDYFCQNYDYKCLALGTDFCGTNNYPSGIKDYFSLEKIVSKLKKMGYKDQIIHDIFFNNACDFFIKNKTFQT